MFPCCIASEWLRAIRRYARYANKAIIRNEIFLKMFSHIHGLCDGTMNTVFDQMKKKKRSTNEKIEMKTLRREKDKHAFFPSSTKEITL